MNTRSDRAELALMVIGPERRERLIVRYADGLSLRYGMAMEAARRYATGLVDDADPAAILAVGQVWSERDGHKPHGLEFFRSDDDTSYEVSGFTDDGMVMVGDGSLHLGVDLFARMWLTAWPDTYTLVDEPQPPSAESPQPDQEADESDAAEGRFDPRKLWVMVSRVREDGLPFGEGLPLLGTHYRAVNWKKPEYEPSYGNALDVPAYLAEHLADYRAGWPDFLSQFEAGDWLSYFNELGSCECDLEVAAYLGRWLWQRVRSDVVTEYGGTVADYDPMLPWAPHYADAVLEVAPYADPEWDIPVDHPLAQCDGQTSLLPW
ncbi:hypothetical protein ACFYY8_31360 [Streptosporangium sp. NPDC001559]|uniref:hypothetical protein n=1 Tax=Streptosporangium sp. NPDC001559 TaxID=3366187 RepID=UPI0036E1E295